MVNMQGGEFLSLMAHMEWADAQIWRAVLSLPDARRDRRLLELLYHLHAVQWVYLQVWRGDPIEVPRLQDLADLPAVAAWARPYYPDAHAFTEGLTREELSGHVTLPWADEAAKRSGPAGPTTLAETLLQVALHSSHHRAQVATRVRELGSDPPPTDFIAWAWKGRPAAEW